MKALTVITLVVSVCFCESLLACGGDGGSFGSVASFGRGVPIASKGGFVSPQFQGVAMAGAQFNLAKQAAITQANAYNARMAPIRIANATRVREQKIARREARKVVMLAKLEARRQAEQEDREFLVQSRTWTDATGNHKVDAVLVDANSWGVKLMKQDGSSVNVPMDRLSRSDRSWVHSKVLPHADENRLMLAGL